MASGKEIRINIVSALNAAGIEATKQQVKAMSESVKQSMADAAAGNKTHWADIKAAWDMGCSAISTAWKALSAGLKSAFKFETQTTQFKTLIGNIDEAKEHMADLKALGDTPPFSLDEFAKASRSLMVMTDGALGYKKSLEMIGDAAAATGHPVEEMGQAVGRMYAFIRDGQPLSRAVMQLRNMGVITPEVAQKLQDLQDAGASNAEIWAEVEKQLGRYNGAMEATEKTGEGLIGAIQSRWDNIVRGFGMAFEDTAKEGMTEVLDKMKELENDGSLAIWAEKTGEAVRSVVDAMKTLAPVVSTIWNALKGTFDAVGSEIGRFAGAVSMGNFKDAFGGIGKEAARAYSDAFDLDGKKAKHYEEVRRAAAEKIAKKEQEENAKAAKREEEEKLKIQKNLADAQKKIDEQRAKDAAAKKSEEEAKAAKKVADEQAKLDRKREEELRRAEEKRIADEIKAQRAETEDGSVPVTFEGDATGSAPSHGGGGQLQQTGAPSSNRQMMERYAQYVSQLRQQRGAYWQLQFGKAQKQTEDAMAGTSHPFGVQRLWDTSLGDYRSNLDNMQIAEELASKKFDRAIHDAYTKMNDYKARAAEEMPTAPTSAAERTASACEGILRHFETGRAN